MATSPPTRQRSAAQQVKSRAGKYSHAAVPPKKSSDRRPVGKAPAVFPAISPLRNARFGGYPAFMAAELAVHRGVLLLGRRSSGHAHLRTQAKENSADCVH